MAASVSGSFKMQKIGKDFQLRIKKVEITCVLIEAC